MADSKRCRATDPALALGWSRSLAVYARGTTGKLAGARIYDDADPPVWSD